MSVIAFLPLACRFQAEACSPADHVRGQYALGPTPGDAGISLTETLLAEWRVIQLCNYFRQVAARRRG